MPPDAEPPRTHRTLDKSRMESFSDGVFGFAITLLAVNLAIHPPGGPLQQLLHGWPSYVAYLISFVTIGGAWLGHTALTNRLTGVDAIFLRINLPVLLRGGGPAVPDPAHGRRPGRTRQRTGVRHRLWANAADNPRPGAQPGRVRAPDTSTRRPMPTTN